MKKIVQVLMLLSCGFVMQASDENSGIREINVPGSIGRTFAVDADSEMGMLMASMNNREAQFDLEQARVRATQTSSAVVIADYQRQIDGLRQTLKNEQNPQTLAWLGRQLQFKEENLQTLQREQSARPVARDGTQEFSGFNRNAMRHAFGGSRK